ncbi:MAG TPA: type II secretion system F family protein [Chloroflexota bacterium]|nr:type II secretion system F family protein [Chloroflexota bacterium]
MSEPLALLLSGALMASTLLIAVAVGKTMRVRRTVARQAKRFAGGPLPARERRRSARRRAADRVRRLWRTRRAELLLGLGVVAATLIGTLRQQPLLGLLLGMAASGGVIWVQRRRRQRRQALLEAQLVPALRTLATATESGYSVRMALDRVVDDLPSPLSEEFAQVIRMVDLGLSLEDALGNLAARIGGEHFEFFAAMVAVQHRIGGSLSTLLFDLARSLQTQMEFKLSLRAKTAQARFSGWVVSAIPLFVLGVIVAVTPQYVAPLFEWPEGRLLVAIAAVLLLAGQLTIQRLSTVEM